MFIVQSEMNGKDMKELLSVCAILKDEASYVYEWLSFHYIVGVRSFVIYLNNSTDKTEQIIKDWAHSDLVKIIDWPAVPGQWSAYQHMIDNFRDVAEWCAFIDADEFLCPRSPIGLPAILDRHAASGAGGLYVHWLMFGSGGHAKAEDLPVTERFTRRGRSHFPPNKIGKSVVRLSEAESIRNSHVIRCKGILSNEKFEAVDQNGEGVHAPPTHDLIAINHYFTKSEEEWISRRAAPRVSKGPGQADSYRTLEDFKRHDVNDVEDTIAVDIMKVVRERFY
jgi:glycosyltransferase involved in cell wall biosynthesis